MKFKFVGKKYPTTLVSLVIAVECETDVRPYRPTQFMVFSEDGDPVGTLQIADMRAAMQDWTDMEKGN